MSDLGISNGRGGQGIAFQRLLRFNQCVQMQNIRVSEVKERGIHSVRRVARFLLGPLLGSTLAVSTLQAQTNFQQIGSFGGPGLSGGTPRAALIEGSDGWLYGVTYGGGASGSGTLFKVSNDGAQALTIYSFASGSFPYGGLAEAADGSLIGTTSSGGTNRAGTVFRCNKDGSGFAEIHTFPAFSGDSSAPQSALIKANDGRLYGTTYGGGVGKLGTVFGMNANGTGYAVLHSFMGATNGADGAQPAAVLCQGADGLLYGTTETGGSNNFGTVFKLSTQGTGYAILHHFAGGPTDGSTLYGGLAQGADGYLYGVTYYGGASDVGTIFRESTNGTGYTVMRSFRSDASGNQPVNGVTAGTNGVLYGTTRFGGSGGGGTVFAINRDGTGYTVLHDFGVLNGDGTQPFGGLLAGTDGVLYGTTYWGGIYATNGSNGTLFRLLAAPPQVVISSITPVSGGYQVAFRSGIAGEAYQIQSSTNHGILSWKTIGTNTAGIDGTFQYFDSACTNVPSRFYRSASF